MIVPRLPPSIDGVGDYGLSLALQMRKDYGVQTEFIVGDPDYKVSEIEGFKIKVVTSRSFKAIIKLLPSEPNENHSIILHYVGYGYAKRGSPVWLCIALANWTRFSKKRKLITMFHEIYAFGPIWTSQFWTSPLQRFVARRLGQLTSFAVTSKRSYATKLSNLIDGKHATMPVLPVFSNVGEPRDTKPLIDRARSLVIFGGAGARKRVYLESKNELLAICDQYKIEVVYDIGPRLDFNIDKILNIEIKIMGTLESDEVSKILDNSLVGFMNYPSAFLCKSGIFAAYCSHGILPIVCGRQDVEIDTTIEGFHYLKAFLVKTNSDNLSEAQSVAKNAYSWYQGHRVSEHAKVFNEFLKA